MHYACKYTEKPISGSVAQLLTVRTSSRCNGALFFCCSTVGRGRQKTIVLKVPVHEEIQDDQESGSETSDSVSNSGQNQNTNNVTLITLNSEGKIHKWVVF